ncbi:MAG: SRPBCC domain-containing protein [candidate division Zixibacteria bacterium]|nr:SRPBCC domain-containing protein [candidate division Zixibacteria bacterium]MDH3936927.1 SRPBCC domain-containing protein [candidate division Zixibacteria bacterium]MDH4032768.1 SRPBCC domain-containing protein [candidate division Zixibacteria bacterium]
MAAKKKHDWSQFSMRVVIKAAPSRVYKAWTEGKELAKWFPVKAEFEARKGGRVYFEWLGDDKLDTTVLAVRKNSLVRFPFGSKGEKVEVKINKLGRGSICELRQYDMKTTEEMKWSMHMGCRDGWTFFLANLKCYLEHGIDLRTTDPKRCYKQGYINC